MRTYLLESTTLPKTLLSLAAVFEHFNNDGVFPATAEDLVNYIRDFFTNGCNADETPTTEFLSFVEAFRPLMEEVEELLKPFNEKVSWMDDELVIVHPQNQVAIILKNRSPYD